MRTLLYDRGKRYEDLTGEAIWDVKELSVEEHVMFGPHTWSFKIAEIDDEPELIDDRIIATMVLFDPFSDRLPSKAPVESGITVHMYDTGMIRLETGYEIENLRRVEIPVGPW